MAEQDEAAKAKAAKEAAAAEAAAAKAKTEKVVQYVGTADVREITKAQWAKIGVEDQATVVWNSENGKKVKESDLSKGAMAYFEKDSGFKIVDAEA